jgi:hypothetical protein
MGAVMRQLLAVGVLAVALAAAPRAKADEPLPPPRVMPGPGAPLPPAIYMTHAPYYRTSAYEVWQYYGVNRAGQWRPRVAYLPHAAFYLQTGQPYPWAVTHNVEFMPYARD